jgi:uncharacterized protein YrrD
MLTDINKFYGKKLAAKDGPIGHVRDFYFDDRSWALLYVVADTGSWLHGRKILLSPHAFANFDENERSLAVRLHMKQIEDSPSIDEHRPVSRQFEEEYYSYYAWPTYWQGPQAWGMGSSPIVVPPPGIATEHVHHTGEEAHLRSTKALNGYKVEATDGAIGHIVGFMMDTKGWAIRDLVIATDPWYMAREAIISLNTVERISYEESKIFVKLTKEQVKKLGEDHALREAAFASAPDVFPSLIE